MKIILEFNNLQEMGDWAREEYLKTQQQILQKNGKEISKFGLPTRIVNALKSAGYSFDFEVIKATDRELKYVKNLGSNSVALIRQAMGNL